MTDVELPSGRVTRSDELLALAARCESEEPSEDLDLAIGKASGWTFGGGRPKGGTWRAPDGQERFGSSFRIPSFTTSLDAAVTLELAGFFVTVVSGKGTPCAVGWLDAESGAQFNGEAKTEPMARCAAALRTRAALAERA